jgi:hypothetical protein
MRNGCCRWKNCLAAWLGVVGFELRVALPVLARRVG